MKQQNDIFKDMLQSSMKNIAWKRKEFNQSHLQLSVALCTYNVPWTKLISESFGISLI